MEKAGNRHSEEGRDQGQRLPDAVGWFITAWLTIVIYNMNSRMGVESQEEEDRALQRCSDHQDLFSVYVRLIIDNAPSIYVFINVTLVIWIAQTVFSNRPNPIPTSLYLLSPFLTAAPLSALQILPLNLSRPSPTHPLLLKTFPTIYSHHILHRQLFSWGPQALQFCATQLGGGRSGSCGEKEVACSGYCVKSAGECPITRLKISSNGSKVGGFEELYASGGKHYMISRAEGVPIVGVAVSYEERCANDEYYSQAFNNESEYWERAKDCKHEGKVSSFAEEVDQMETNSFFALNAVAITTTDPALQEVFLSTVRQFKIKSGEECAKAEEELKSLEEYVKTNPVAPQYSQPLLIVSFILLIIELVWLICYYCHSGLRTEKNILAGMFATVELVIVGFIYSSSRELFEIGKLSKTMTSCIDQPVPAFKEWNFGLESPEVYQMVLFVNTAFLGLYISALFFDYFGFEEYRRVAVHLPRVENNNLLAQ